MARKLILIALIALVVCAGFGFKASCTEPPEEWRLTVKSTEGGFVTRPGEGMFWYKDGERIELQAIPHAGYRFVNWTGKVWTMNDVYRADAHLHMRLDYTITANFAPLEAGD